MLRYIILIIFALVFAWGCKNNPAATQPNPCYPFACDTCDNYLPPPTGIQTDYGVPSVCWMWRGRISPDRRYIVFEGGNADWSHPNFDSYKLPITGLCVMEIESGRIVHFIPGFFISWAWGPDSKTVYFLESGLQPISSLNIETKEVRQYPHIGKFEWLALSPSGNYMFCSGVKKGVNAYGLVRWDMRLDTAEYISKQKEIYNSFMILNDSVVCSIIPDKMNSPHRGAQGVYYYNVNSKELTRIECPAFGDKFGDTRRGELSPDKKRIIFDPCAGSDENDGYLDIGVWVLNLETLEVSQILPRHPYFYFRNHSPVWSTNTSFVVEWFCRKDSTRLLYEYDLNGKPLRQLTKRSTEFWIVK